MLVTRYGSLCNGTPEEPAGTAHFLEHKMFEGKREHAFAAFERLSADANAFTCQNATAYYVSAEARFYEALRALCRMVAEPWFTEENVAREKPIIEREIAMYDDEPFWLCWLELLAALYPEGHPARDNIAGTAATIAPITHETLTAAYNKHYAPGNMALIVVGDAEAERVCRVAERIFKQTAPAERKSIQADTTPPAKLFRSKKLGIARPVFHIGFKDMTAGEPLPKRQAAARIALDYLAGEGSALCQSLFGKALADDTLAASYSGGENFGLSVIAGASDEPQAVYEAVLKELSALKGAIIPSGDFDRLRRKHIGRLARVFDTLHETAAFTADCFANNVAPTDITRAAQAVTAKDAAEWLMSVNESDIALAIVESGE